MLNNVKYIEPINEVVATLPSYSSKSDMLSNPTLYVNNEALQNDKTEATRTTQAQPPSISLVIPAGNKTIH